MINAFGNSLKAFLKNPFILVPAIAAMVVAGIFTEIVVIPVLEALIDFMLLKGGMELGLFEGVFVFSKQYFELVLLVFAAFFFSALISAMLALFYSAYAVRLGKQEAFSESLSAMFSMLPGAFGIIVSGVVFSILGATFFLIALIVLPLHEISSVFIGLLLFAFAFFFIKLFLFAMPAMAIDGLNARDSLAASWRLTSKKFFECFLVLVIAIFSIAFIANLGLFLVAFLGENILSLVLTLAFEALVFAFATLFFAFYYQDNRKETESIQVKRHESWKKRAKK
ncbi:MAG: glycerophosphoryl diester phosphodiesterase membrane domain-containing protein [Candidatus Diapherotrites archaeon]